MTPSLPDPCLVPGCDVPAPHAGLLRLCADHLALAAEVHGVGYGVSGPMPAPCRLCGSRLGVQHVSGWTCAVCEWPHGEHPDGELPVPRVDVVYYLRFADRVKIGTTANPPQRFTAIRHEEVLAFERGDRRVEHRRHVQFDDERAGSSEWFELSPRLAAHMETLAAGADPWDRWRRWLAEAVAVR
ncbi:GIY-YIG nuclease family protein [uncultured Amnibacterium sp.]|uniref:GIY-YIG nuclease family protein n=1 Tax=uncultured Amnibacterium sp. TaxID=1631851 RepID=UPI0035CBEBEB